MFVFENRLAHNPNQLISIGEPQSYMFREMRAALGIPKSVDILDHIYALPSAEAQEDAHEQIRTIERRAMVLQRSQPGLVELMSYLQSRGIRKAICTRNFDTPVNHLLTKFLDGHEFHPVITREFRPPKPHPAGILHIAEQWGLKDGGASLIMVGDSIDDMTAGYRAGAATVLLGNPENEEMWRHEHTDLVIRRLDELVPILEDGFVGKEDVVDEKVVTEKMPRDTEIGRKLSG
jgi:HAD superfamily hydrolase (TIGR01549 family)